MTRITVRERDHSKKTCAFTGYRPQKLPYGTDEGDARCARHKTLIYAEIETAVQNGYGHFMHGGALGGDMFFAEAVMELKNKYPFITLETVLPFKGVFEKWSIENRRRLGNIIAASDIVTTICDTYSVESMFMRNRFMVDSCSLLIALYDGKSGGTQMTVNYAVKKGIEVKLII